MTPIRPIPSSFRGARTAAYQQVLSMQRVTNPRLIAMNAFIEKRRAARNPNYLNGGK